MSVRLSLAPIALACAVLSACGSGSSQAPALAPAAQDLVVAGSAATGAAMPKARIAIKCASGTGSAITADDGRYSASIAGGSLPCAIRATSADGSIVLHSALEGAGSGSGAAGTALTANVTPMSELIVAQAQGTNAALMFDQFENNQTRLTPAVLAEAKLRVKDALASIVDLSGADPIKDVLVAAANGRPGNGLDQKLDTLRDKLIEAGMKVQELGDVLTANADDSAHQVVASVVGKRSLNCRGLRSGTYRVVLAGQSSAVSEFTLDAATLLVTSGGVTEQWTAEACTLSSPAGMKLEFGAQGLGSVRASNSSFGIVMPKQNLNLSELSGSWSWVRRHLAVTPAAAVPASNLSVKGSGAVTPGSGAIGIIVPIIPVSAPAYSVSWGEMRFTPAGETASASSCDATACRALSGADLRTFSKSADGGFVSADGIRLYMFRAAGGATLLVRLAAAGGDAGDLSFARRGPPLGVPRLGSTFSESGLSMSSVGAVATDFTRDSFTIKANDRKNKTFSRLRSSDCQLDSWTLRQPFAQMLERGAGTSASCTDSSASALAVSDVKALSGQGLGLSASVSPSQRSMMLSVTAPKQAAEGKDDDEESED